MTITPPSVVTKTDVKTTATPIANKVVAADVNELVRASTDAIEKLNEIVEELTDTPIGGVAFFDQTNEVTIDNTTDFFKIESWAGALLSPELNKLTFSTDEIVADAGMRERVFYAQAELIVTAGNNQTLQSRIALNDVTQPCSTSEAVTGSGGRSEGLVSGCLVRLTPGDAVSVYVRNTSGTDNIVVKDINLVLLPVGSVVL